MGTGGATSNNCGKHGVLSRPAYCYLTLAVSADVSLARGFTAPPFFQESSSAKGQNVAKNPIKVFMLICDLQGYDLNTPAGLRFADSVHCGSAENSVVSPAYFPRSRL